MRLLLHSGIATFLLLLSIVTPSFSRECAGLQQTEKMQCLKRAKEGINKETFDKDSGVKVVNYDSDIDWKNPKSRKIPWSSLIKITSKLTGDFYYRVVDRDYKTNSSNGLQEGFVTSWTRNTLSGFKYSMGGCGFWVCTYGSQINDFSGAIELFYNGKSFLIYGDAGEYRIPGEFVDHFLQNGGISDLSLKLSRGKGKQSVVPIGPQTRKSLAALFIAETKVWNLPKLSIEPQIVPAKTRGTWR